MAAACMCPRCRIRRWLGRTDNNAVKLAQAEARTERYRAQAALYESQRQLAQIRTVKTAADLIEQLRDGGTALDDLAAVAARTGIVRR